MGRSRLIKLLRQRAKDDPLTVKRSATGGGNETAKRCKPIPRVTPHEETLVDMDQVLQGQASAYASLIGTLSSSSLAMRLRKMQQDGDSDEEEEEEDDDDDEAQGQQDDGDSDPMVDERHECLEASEAGRAKQDGEAGRAKQDAEADQSSAPTLNTWTRKGLKAAKAAEAADADGGKQPKTKQQGGTGFQQSAAAVATAVLPGVPDSWVTHVDKQLSESELESLRSCTTRPKLFDAPEHPEYKAVQSRHTRWKLSGRTDLPPAPSSLAAFGVKERLQTRWIEVHEEDSERERKQCSEDRPSVSATPALPQKVSDASDLGVGAKAAVISGGGFVSDRQRSFFASLNSYSDVVVAGRAYPVASSSRTRDGLDSPDEYMDAYLLHALNHNAKTADRIKKNNDRIEAAEKAAADARSASKAEESTGKKGKAGGRKSKGVGEKVSPASPPSMLDRISEDQNLPRDQGYTRPKVLILLPTRNLAFKLVRRLVALAMRETRGDTVQGKEKFVEQFTNPEEDEEDEMDEKLRTRWLSKPAEWRALNSGNTEDHFRVGIRITRGSIRLFADFFQSDVIVASPLALATKLEENDLAESDFLSSIELLIIDRADVMSCGQNWSHLERVVEALNKKPKDMHGVDINRLREWALEHNSQFYRQTVLLTSWLNADMNRLFSTPSFCCNYEGQIRVVPEYNGVLSAVVPQVQQLFERFACHSSADSPSSSRLEFFKRSVWPRIKENGADGQMIFCASYFDFVRVRRFLIQEDADFASICEHTLPPDVTAARSRFFHRHKRILLYTERAHFYFRHRIRGIKV